METEMPDELDKVIEEIMKLKKTRDQLANSINDLLARVQEIKDDPLRNLVHKPGFMQEPSTYPRNVWVISQSSLRQDRENCFVALKEILSYPLRVDTPAIYDEKTAVAWAVAFNVIMELRKIEARGDLVCPEDLWKVPGYIISCNGYVLEIQEVSSNSNITATLSPIFTSREAAEYRISVVGKDRIIQAWRTMMFSPAWPHGKAVVIQPEIKEIAKK
jgi:hypothetical protein